MSLLKWFPGNLNSTYDESFLDIRLISVEQVSYRPPTEENINAYELLQVTLTHLFSCN